MPWSGRCRSTEEGERNSPQAYEMRRGGAADGEASVLISEAIPKGEIEMFVG